MFYLDLLLLHLFLHKHMMNIPITITRINTVGTTTIGIVGTCASLSFESFVLLFIVRVLLTSELHIKMDVLQKIIIHIASWLFTNKLDACWELIAS